MKSFEQTSDYLECRCHYNEQSNWNKNLFWACVQHVLFPCTASAIWKTWSLVARIQGVAKDCGWNFVPGLLQTMVTGSMKILPGILFAATLLLVAYSPIAYPSFRSIRCTSSILLRLTTIILFFPPNKKWEKRKKHPFFYMPWIPSIFVANSFKVKTNKSKLTSSWNTSCSLTMLGWPWHILNDCSSLMWSRLKGKKNSYL